MRTGVHSHGERGAIIVIALLVVLSLAGVALVAAQRVSSEIDRSGNQRASKQGEAVTWSGAAAGLSLMESQGGSVVTAMRASGGQRLDLDEGSFSAGELLDLDEGGSFGPEAMDDTQVDFDVRFGLLGEVDGAVAGYSAGQYTFIRVFMRSLGNFSANPIPVTPPAGEAPEPMGVAQNEVRGFLLIGPLMQSQFQQ